MNILILKGSSSCLIDVTLVLYIVITRLPAAIGTTPATHPTFRGGQTHVPFGRTVVDRFHSGEAQGLDGTARKRKYAPKGSFEFSPLPLSTSLTHHYRKSLYSGLATAYGGPFAFALFPKLVQDCLTFVQPQLLRRLLSFITDYQDARQGIVSERPTPLIGFSYTFLMFFASIVQTIILHQVRLPLFPPLAGG